MVKNNLLYIMTVGADNYSVQVLTTQDEDSESKTQLNENQF